MEKWEYKQTEWLGETDMDDLGEKGWELVGVINRTVGHFNTMPKPSMGGTYGVVEGDIKTRVTLIFKRRKL